MNLEPHILSQNGEEVLKSAQKKFEHMTTGQTPPTDKYLVL